MIWIPIIILGAAAAGAVYYFLVFDRSSVFDRALSLAREGAYTDARGLIRSRIEREPDNPKGHFTMAQIYAMEGDEHNELEHLQELRRMGRPVAEYPRPRLLNRIGEILYRQEEYEESYEVYQEALGTAARNEEALAHLAFMAIGQGEFELAEKHFKKLVSLAPQSAEYRIARGVGLSMLKKKEALQELEEGLDLDRANDTARFLLAIECYRQGEHKKVLEQLTRLMNDIEDTAIRYLIHKMAAASHYMVGQNDMALESADTCLHLTLEETWDKEEYDARISVSYLSMLNGDLDKANENLLELEIRNPTDQSVMRISDFRMDLEEGVATIEEVSPRGFDFQNQLKEWVRNRIHPEMIYRVSGLQMDEVFSLSGAADGPRPARRSRAAGPAFDADELIETFNALPSGQFEDACARIVASLGYKVDRTLPNRDPDGLDLVAFNTEDKKDKALFEFRKWKNQPISDIFLRNMQNTLNEMKVMRGFVVAGARLTTGAEAALQNLKKIQVINGEEFGAVLVNIIKPD
ncbi:MAG: restriction endonuclease [Leptospiraceae bacterium]|nr:restriction endonuclease [Leptospiraceae bacterium]